MRKLHWVCLGCFSVWSAMTGCGHERRATAPQDAAGIRAIPEPTDAAVRPAMDASVVADASTTDASGLISATDCSGELPVMKTRDPITNVERDPDWSCYATTDADDAGAADADDAGAADVATQIVTFRFLGFPMSVIEGLTVDFHVGRTTVGAPAASRTFEPDAGEVTFPFPASQRRVSIHTHALQRADSRYDISELRDYESPIPGDGGPVQGYIQLRDKRAIAALVFGDDEPYDPDKAVLLVTVLDCAGQDVGGAQVELVDLETGVVVQSVVQQGQPRSAYLRYALPEPRCTYTTNGTNQAAWVMINAPTNVSVDRIGHGYKVRLKGRMRAEQPQPVTFAEQAVELSAGTTTAVRAYRSTR